MTSENGGSGSNTNANIISNSDSGPGRENEVVGDLGATEADQNEGDVGENEDDTWGVVGENEDDIENLSSGQETAYLDSSDVRSYETDSDGDIVAKKADKSRLDYNLVGKHFLLKIRILSKLKLTNMMRLGREEFEG
ncbi:hypothetical protein V6N13_108737 [Hibiscus sabdariffa]